jgi:predicted RNA-binding protein YlxR (DUF448 family)
MQVTSRERDVGVRGRGPSDSPPTTDESPETTGPVRTCAGCGEKVAVDQAPHELVRLVRGPDLPGPDGKTRTEIAFDLGGSSFGRGAWVHPTRPCLERAIKSGFSRAFKAPVKTDVAAVSHAFREAATRRVEGLLGTARRTRKVALGTDATLVVLREAPAGRACVVVAVDAKSVVERREIADAISRGSAVSFGSKNALGALFGREEVAVLAVTHDALAEEIKRTCRAAAAMAGSGSDAVWVSSEVR